MRRMRLLALVAVLLLAFIPGTATNASARSAGDSSTPENAVRSYFLALNEHNWGEAWNYLQQHADEPQVHWAGFYRQWTSIAENNPGFTVQVEVLGSSMLPNWKAPQRTLKMLDKQFPDTDQGRKDQHEYLMSQVKEQTVGPQYQNVAEVAVRITWTQADGSSSTEERALHLAALGNHWKLLFHGPTNLD